MISSVLPTYARAPLSFVKGEGSWLMTADGERYLDLGAGIAVNVLGHANPDLIGALTAQANKLWHVSNLYQIEGQVSLAGKLTQASFADTVFFTNSGTETAELAIKMARKFHSAAGHPERIEIITFSGSFHGRSTGAIAASGGAKMVDGFGPLMPGFVHLPFGDMEALEAAVGDTTAAIMIEPVQGEGGIMPVPAADLKRMRDLADTHGALLIFDEVQCGIGRTGKLFAHEWAGVTPDILMSAKGIGGGFPLGALLATERAASGMGLGTHGSTYGGNPLAMAVGNKVMDVVNTPAFLGTVSDKAERLRKGLEALVASHPTLFELVRGSGLMLGVKCKADLPVAQMVAAGYKAGVITVPAGDNVMRLLPPLNIKDEDIDEGLARLEAAAQSLEETA